MKFWLLSVCCFATLFSTGQLRESDLSDLLEEWYEHQMDASTDPIYTGEMDLLVRKSRTSHPYYKTFGWQKADLVYRGSRYRAIDVSFDLVEQVLIARHPSPEKRGGVKLKMHLLSQFEFEDEAFRRSLYEPNEKLYAVLLTGKNLNLLCRRMKTENLSKDGVVYREVNNYFIEYREQLWRIKREGDLRTLFEDYKSIKGKVKLQTKKAKFTIFDERKLLDYMSLFDEEVGKR